MNRLIHSDQSNMSLFQYIIGEGILLSRLATVGSPSFCQCDKYQNDISWLILRFPQPQNETILMRRNEKHIKILIRKKKYIYIPPFTRSMMNTDLQYS